MNKTQTTAAQPRWGAQDRDLKAHAIEQTLRHFMHVPLSEAVCIDLGCGSGGIAFHLAPEVKSMTGIDPEPWEKWQELTGQRQNLSFVQESVEQLTAADASVDLIICNQVYEHVPDPQHLIGEIQRILKPGGYCYFAGPNLLFPIEPHVFWPFVHWLPRGLAVGLMRRCGSQAILDAYSTDFWTLTRWLRKFEIENAVPYILRHPQHYYKSGLLWRALSWIPATLLRLLTPLSPGFVFVLRKPGR